MKKFYIFFSNNSFLIILLTFSIILFLLFQKTELIGGTDISKAHLAGATAFLEGNSYPLKQRPPIYSAFLASIAYLSNIEVAEKVAIAQESGDVIRLDVFQALLEYNFLSRVFITNLFIWLCSLWFYKKTLQELGVSNKLILASLLLFFAPSSWIMTTQLWEATIIQFLFSVSLFATVKWYIFHEKSKFPIIWLIISAICLSIIGFSRAAFQLLPIFIAFFIPFIYSKREKISQRLIYPIILTTISILLIGSWSARNLIENGFLGTGGSLGVSLSTRTATYLDDNVDPTNEYSNLFVFLRDERYLKSPSHSPNLWGEFASRFLIEEKGMTYAQANKTLITFNLKAILKAPLNYLATVLSTVIGFHFPNIPDWPTPVRLLLTPLEFIIIICLFFSISTWLTLHLVSILNSKLINIDWTILDQVIAICLLIYIYGVLIHCGIDQGITYQRMSIQYIINLIIVLIVHRFDLLSFVKEKANPLPF